MEEFDYFWNTVAGFVHDGGSFDEIRWRLDTEGRDLRASFMKDVRFTIQYILGPGMYDSWEYVSAGLYQRSACSFRDAYFRFTIWRIDLAYSLLSCRWCTTELVQECQGRFTNYLVKRYSTQPSLEVLENV